jgi:tetratricopeptide (TPR) repeat protein
MGLVRFFQGRLEESVGQLERAIAAFSVGGGNRRGEQNTRWVLARVLLAAGDHARAEEEARKAIALGAAPLATAAAEATLARVFLAAGRPDDAVATARVAAERFASQGGSEDVYVPASVALIFEATGRTDEARPVVETAHRRVLELAARIGDADMRASFLERVPENAEICELAARLGPR